MDGPKTDKRSHVLLLALGELVGREVSVGALLDRIVAVVIDLLDADRGTLYLIDPVACELVSIAAHLPEVAEIRVPLSRGIAGHVARTGEVVNLASAGDDARFWADVDQRTGYTTESMLAAPLVDSAGTRIGVLQLLNKRDGVFDERDADLLVDLAHQAAALLEETTVRGADAPLDALRDADGGLAEPSEHIAPLVLGDRFNRIVGYGDRMRQVFRQVRRVADTEATVLLRGESGTGKSLLARALHYNSGRRDGPFVAVDCTTLPETLIENELFGHEKGAYTGADTRKAGRVEAASGGTLFLDEIGDLPSSVQGKLLTLLQDHTYTRVGGTERHQADIRIVAATNRPIERLVAQGDFREDLYYRLRVVQIDIPPLRDRGRQDLLQLIEHFLDAAKKRHNRPDIELKPEALEMLLGYSWPGNVRELENCLESAVIFAEDAISPSTLPLPRANTTRKLRALGTLPAAMHPGADLEAMTPFVDEPSLAELEARYIAWLLERHEGNRSKCARVLDIGRNTLLRKMKKYDLE